jgi:HTH-type transcriptional regulator/antitoxin HipB
MATNRYTIRTSEQLIPLFQAFRKQQNLTQAELANRLGVGQQTISQLERRPNKATLERLLRALAAMDVEMVLVSKASQKIAPDMPHSASETW